MEANPENVKTNNEEKTDSNSIPGKNVQAIPHEVPKKAKEERSRKDEKGLERFMKSLNSIPTTEEKLLEVCKKYIQSTDENRKLHFYIKQSDNRYDLQTKEKDHLQQEYNKTVLLKSKLENLCRELQKQNKAIKEETLLKIREGEELRKETQNKFQSALTDITDLLQQNNEKNTKLRHDNISMKEKFKGLVQQYQLREQQVDRMGKQMLLEAQLSEAKLQKANLEHQAEKDILLCEMEQLKLEVNQSRAKMSESQSIETALRSQISIYTDKYDEFQNTLVKSNQVFTGFKGEMEKMSKKIQKLETESLSWKRRWETSQAALIECCGDKQAVEQRGLNTLRQLDQMQRLCRTLQGDRTVLLNTLKENNIEQPPFPPPAPAPAPAPAPSIENSKVAQANVLRQSLAQLQNQLNVLTAPQEPPKVEKAEKTKKSKSKKNKDKTRQQEAVKVEDAEATKPQSAEVVSLDVAATQSEVVETQSDVVETQSDVVETQSNVVETQNENAEATTSDVVIKQIDNSEAISLEAAESIETKSEQGVNKLDENNESNAKSPEDVALVEAANESNVSHNEENESEVRHGNVVNNNDSIIVEMNSNEEMSHFIEIKPILEGKNGIKS